MAKDVIADLEARISTNLTEFKRQMNQSANSVETNTAKMNRYLKTTKSSFSKLSTGVGSFLKKGALMAGVATGAAVGIGYLVKRNLEAADAIAKTADGIGISTDALQIYRKQADLSGMSTQMFDKSIGAFAVRMGKLALETGTLHTYFSKTNSLLKDQLLAAGSVDDQYNIFMETLAGVKSHTEALAMAEAAVGMKAARDLMNIVKEGTAAYKLQQEEIKALGIVIDEDLLRGAESAIDALANVSDVISVQFANAALALAPAITTVSSEITKWITENRGLIDQKTDEYIQKIADAAENFDGAAFQEKLFKIAAAAETAANVLGLIPKAIDGWSMIFDIAGGDYDKLVIKMNAGSSEISEAIGLVKIDLENAKEALDLLTMRDNVIFVEISEEEYNAARQKIIDLETKLAELEAEPTTVTLAVESKDALADINDIWEKLETIEDPPLITISADTDPAVAEVLLLKEKIEKGEHAVQVDANTEDAEEGIERLIYMVEGKEYYLDVKIKEDEITGQVESVLSQIETMKADVLLGADPATALFELSKLKSQIAVEEAKLSIGGDSTMAQREIDKIQKEITKTEAALKVLADVEPAEKTVEYLKTKIDTTVATMAVDVNTSRADAALDNLAAKAKKMGFSTGMSVEEFEDYYGASVATINKSTFRKMGISGSATYADGGPVGLAVGPSHAQGGILGNFEGGEYIIPKKITELFGKEHFDRYLSGGVQKMASGGAVFPSSHSFQSLNLPGDLSKVLPPEWVTVMPPYDSWAQADTAKKAAEKLYSGIGNWDNPIKYSQSQLVLFSQAIKEIRDAYAAAMYDGTFARYSGETSTMTSDWATVRAHNAALNAPKNIFNSALGTELKSQRRSVLPPYQDSLSDPPARTGAKLSGGGGQSQKTENINININGGGIGDRPFMSMRETADIIVEAINFRKARLGEDM